MAAAYYLINSFQCPNWVDEFCVLLSGTEFKIFYATFRQTIADLGKRRMSPENRKAGIAYAEFRKLTGLSNSTIARDLKALVSYCVIVPIPGAISAKTGQEYRVNVVFESNQPRGQAAQYHLSNRLMDCEGLRQRKEAALEKNRQKTAKARKNKAARRNAHQDVEAASESGRPKPVNTLELSPARQRNASTPLPPSVPQRDFSPPPSVLQRDLKREKKRGETLSCNPHHTPLDPATGMQPKLSACVSEQCTIFDYLEQKLRKDTRVRAHPPIQPYPVIFEAVMTLRQISVWQLRQLITGILADTCIENPIGALRSPDTFRMEQYLLAAKDPAPVTTIRQGDVWQQALAMLEQRINRPSFNTWLRPTRLLGITGRTVQIGVPDEVFPYWLGEYYQYVITEALTETLGYEPTVTFTVTKV